MLWFDDFDGTSVWRKILSLVAMKTNGWRDGFADWVEALPTSPLNVPSESEREKLKREYREEVARKEQMVKDLQDKIASSEQRLKDQAANAEQRMNQFQAEAEQRAARAEESLQDEIRKLKRELREAERNLPSSCFSPDSVVLDRALGPVTLKDLVVGSEVATSEGWSTVTTFLHWHPNATVRALQIVHHQGSLTLSPEHMVFAMTEPNGVARAIPAMEVEAGAMWLQVVHPKGDRIASFVHSVEQTTMEGYYAPLTSSGTILVDNVVASCYTQHSTFKISHWATNILSAPLRFISLWFLTYLPSAGDRHPYVQFPLDVLDSVASVTGSTKIAG